jgi:hypothetical protein
LSVKKTSLPIQEERFRFDYALLCGPVGGLLKYSTRDSLPLTTHAYSVLKFFKVSTSAEEASLISFRQTGNRTNS